MFQKYSAWKKICFTLFQLSGRRPCNQESYLGFCVDKRLNCIEHRWYTLNFVNKNCLRPYGQRPYDSFDKSWIVQMLAKNFLISQIDTYIRLLQSVLFPTCLGPNNKILFGCFSILFFRIRPIMCVIFTEFDTHANLFS